MSALGISGDVAGRASGRKTSMEFSHELATVSLIGARPAFAS
jgi:hypothetical protein